jgi:copper transport protein
VWPSAALAHATLIRSSPGNGAVLASPPPDVRLEFDDPVQPAGGNDVVRNDGGSVLRGVPRVERGGRVLVLPLRRRIRNGDYSVRWRALSDDGHFVTGVLAFAVGAGRAPPRSVLRAEAGNPTARDVVSRWLLFAGLLVAAGTVTFSRLAYRAPHPRLDGLILGGCVLFAVGAGSLAHEAGTGTRFGLALAVGAGLAAAGAACATIPLRLPASACAVAIAAVPSFAGHALDAGVPRLNVVVDLLHIAAAAVWVGGLVGIVVLRPGAAVVRRVSVLALGSVLVLAATGTVRAIYELRALDQLWTTGYGRAIVVKAGLLLTLATLGWLNRSRLSHGRVVTELVLLAGVVVAVAFLTELRPGRNAARPASEPAPPGALVLAQEDGARAVAVAVLPRAAVVTVLAPSGRGAAGLDVSIAGKRAEPCGRGCYRADVTAPRPGRLRVTVGGRAVVFELPRSTPPADALVERATTAFRGLRSVEYIERLASSPTNRIVTRWRLEAPNRLAYDIRGGASGILIGPRRWDRGRPGGRWRSTEISPLRTPEAPWGGKIVDAHVLRQTGRDVVVAWANPQIPAWFTARFDRRTLLARELGMTAAAHFMRHRYVSFNRPLGIRPPR